MQNKKLLIIIVSILAIVFLLLITKNKKTNENHTNNKQTISLQIIHNHKIPKFENVKDCSFLPIKDIDKAVKLQHTNISYKQSMGDVKSCDIEYPNGKEIIFEYDKNISIQRAKEIANKLKFYAGYTQFNSIKPEHICTIHKKTNSIVQITFKVNDTSSISVRAYKFNFTKQDWERLGMAVAKMF